MMMVEAMAVNQRDTLAALQVLLWVGVPVLLWGDPGTGKTETVRRYAAEAGWSTQSVIASLHDPTDFSGLPIRNGDGVTYVPPRWACEVADNDGVTLVFLDEVNTATPATQNALMRVVQEHRVGELDLGKDVRFVAAANPVDPKQRGVGPVGSVGEPVRAPDLAAAADRMAGGLSRRLARAAAPRHRHNPQQRRR